MSLINLQQRLRIAFDYFYVIIAFLGYYFYLFNYPNLLFNLMNFEKALQSSQYQLIVVSLDQQLFIKFLEIICTATYACAFQQLFNLH